MAYPLESPGHIGKVSIPDHTDENSKEIPVTESYAAIYSLIIYIYIHVHIRKLQLNINGEYLVNDLSRMPLFTLVGWNNSEAVVVFGGESEAAPKRYTWISCRFTVRISLQSVESLRRQNSICSMSSGELCVMYIALTRDGFATLERKSSNKKTPRDQ